MMDAGWKMEFAKAIITNACRVLQGYRAGACAFTRGLCESGNDCYVLLEDATKLFCAAVSQRHGETVSRWSPALTEFLFQHPEQCDETLTRVERREFNETFQPPVPA